MAEEIQSGQPRDLSMVYEAWYTKQGIPNRRKLMIPDLAAPLEFLVSPLSPQG